MFKNIIFAFNVSLQSKAVFFFLFYKNSVDVMSKLKQVHVDRGASAIFVETALLSAGYTGFLRTAPGVYFVPILISNDMSAVADLV